VKPEREQKDKGCQSLPHAVRIGLGRRCGHAAPQIRARGFPRRFDFDDKSSEMG
jgi:hypothetical protein